MSLERQSRPRGSSIIQRPAESEGRWQPLRQPPTVESAIGTSGAATTIEGGPLPLTEAGKKIYEHRIQNNAEHP
jgi:hypothetical protein